eukprot:jgi/Mesvir1/25402/Mv01439-RA.1
MAWINPTDGELSAWDSELDEDVNAPSEADEALSEVEDEQEPRRLRRRLDDGLDERATPEQREILEHARRNERGPVVITAGPGTGKTATLEMLVPVLLSLNHRVIYLVYNRAAKADAKERMPVRPRFSTMTLHGAALRYGDIPASFKRSAYSSDVVVTNAIRSHLEHDILSFLQPTNPEKALRLASHWIFKTLAKWYNSKGTPEALTSPRPDYTYYPAKLKHGEISKVPYGDFYVRMAAKVWELMKKGAIPITPDCYLKQAQLAGLSLPWDVILLDESQDMSECMLSAFVLQQCDRPDGRPPGCSSQGSQGSQSPLGKALCPHSSQPAPSSHVKPHAVYIVGDAAQSIYGFRGANPAYLNKLRDSLQAHTFSLTQSFRFGSNIACIANQLLKIKENSPQGSNFHMYKVQGVARDPGTVWNVAGGQADSEGGGNDDISEAAARGQGHRGREEASPPPSAASHVLVPDGYSTPASQNERTTPAATAVANGGDGDGSGWTMGGGGAMEGIRGVTSAALCGTLEGGGHGNDSNGTVAAGDVGGAVRVTHEASGVKRQRGEVKYEGGGGKHEGRGVKHEGGGVKREGDGVKYEGNGAVCDVSGVTYGTGGERYEGDEVKQEGEDESSGVMSPPATQPAPPPPRPRPPLALPLTVVARSNAMLISRAVELLAHDPCLRIAINVGAENRIEIACKHVLGLYEWKVSGRKPSSRRFQPYDSFAEFEQEVGDLELSEYYGQLTMLEQHGDRLPQVVATMQECVLGPLHAKENADIILSTCHQAKGIEWDNVEVCNDYDELHKVAVQKPNEIKWQYNAGNAMWTSDMRALFEIRSNDCLNLWYVACTRAKKRLILPPRWWALQGAMLAVGRLVREEGDNVSRDTALSHDLFEKVRRHVAPIAPFIGMNEPAVSPR